MANEFSRSELILGSKAMDKLAHSTVAIFGVGGVGGYVVEALARTGIHHFILIDNDTVSLTNINRQIIATHDTVGKLKVEVMKDRILSINPDAIVEIYPIFYLPDTRDQFDFKQYDYIVDAIDTITAKLDIIVRASEDNIPIISAMGAGNKLDPTQFEVTDIYKTSVCPLAKVMRRELKKRGIKKLKVIYSKELPITPNQSLTDEECNKKVIPGSVAFVPSVAGMIIAGEVIKDLIKDL